jgi:hypothetical protein
MSSAHYPLPQDKQGLDRQAGSPVRATAETVLVGAATYDSLEWVEEVAGSTFCRQRYLTSTRAFEAIMQQAGKKIEKREGKKERKITSVVYIE